MLCTLIFSRLQELLKKKNKKNTRFLTCILLKTSQCYMSVLMSTYTRRSKFWREFLNSAVFQNFLGPQWQSQSLIMLTNEAVLLCSGKITTWGDMWSLSPSLMFIEWDNLGKVKSVPTNFIWEPTLGINNSLTGTRAVWLILKVPIGLCHTDLIYEYISTHRKKKKITVCPGLRICYMSIYNLKMV